MTCEQVSLQQVELELAKKSYQNRLPPALEHRFQAFIRPRRIMTMKKGLVPILIFYNMFLFNDYLMAPDTLSLSAFIHFAIVSPWIVLGSFMFGRPISNVIRYAFAGSVPFVMFGQIMLIYAFNKGPAADHYLYLAFVIVVYMNVNQRLGYRFAATMTCILTGVYLVGITLGPSPLYVKINASSILIAIGWATLLTNTMLERNLRQSFVVSLREQLRLEEAEFAAGHDNLTGLWNRRQLESHAANLWATWSSSDRDVAVLMIDIDRFKLFNDTYGHPAGDVCLKRVADTIRNAVRPDDSVVRFGGEEFLVLMPDCDARSAIVAGEGLRAAISALEIAHQNNGLSIVTASIGCMAGPIAGVTLAELIDGADAALYAAKRSGRNQVWPHLTPLDDSHAGHGQQSVRTARSFD